MGYCLFKTCARVYTLCERPICVSSLLPSSPPLSPLRLFSDSRHSLTPSPFLLPVPFSVAVSVFGAFLRSEFSEENLQFFLACEQYRQSSNTFSLGRRAKEISATYIQPGAPREVSLHDPDRLKDLL